MDLLARTFPSDVCGADTKDNRAKFALRMFGYRLKSLVFYEPDDLKIETLHGFMNVLKHFVAALYAVFVGWKLGHKFQAVLTKHGVAHFVGVGKDGKTETCSITNGVHTARRSRSPRPRPTSPPTPTPKTARRRPSTATLGRRRASPTWPPSTRRSCATS